MTERIINLHSELTYSVHAPTTILLKVAAMRTARQAISDEILTVNPSTSVDYLQEGPLGNRACRLSLQPGSTTIHYSATAAIEPKHPSNADLNELDYTELPAEVLPYLNPSRYCESDKLGKFAADNFGHIDRGFNRVSQISEWVFNNLSYTPGSTGPSSTACDVLLQRTGVCRDYAHVAIALCRALGIPARYVSGYAVNLNPPDFHGFFEAYLGGDWILFDATRLAPIAGFVRIGAGRDAADVAFATLIGQATLTGKTVQATDPQLVTESPSGEALSTA
ncbi:transglutaminase-like domain-containing protein [Granulosicoccus sp. 3-233]|uniref:transglutaminase-like domain-containing protein n=1 Tax=Granulosicoccus sp. 3-233 TaxID=3417969 RepID=UPI003D34E644